MEPKAWVDQTWDDNDPDNYVFTRVDVEYAFKEGAKYGSGKFARLMESIRVLDDKAIHRQLSKITADVIREYRKIAKKQD
jgi:hypothetical protein